jgi:hypothetical protein
MAKAFAPASCPNETRLAFEPCDNLPYTHEFMPVFELPAPEDR